MNHFNTFVLFAVAVLTPLNSLRADDSGKQLSPSAEVENTARQELWESSKMVEARLYMDELFATSVKATPDDAEEFWAGLETMSTAELKHWLAKFNYERRRRARLTTSLNRAREYKLAAASEARRRNQQIHAQFNSLVRKGATLAQSRVEKGFNRTSKQKSYQWYSRRRLWFGFWF